MTYGFDLTKMPLQAFKDIIKEGYLIPSMRPLREGIEDHFAVIAAKGIASAGDLAKKLKNQKAADAFSCTTGIDPIYMTRLRRLISSYRAKPRKLEDFPDIDDTLFRKLADKGIKTSKSLFAYFASNSTDIVAGKFSLSKEKAETLKSLMEVTQLRYVSPLFATAMVRSGHDSIEVVAKSSREAFLEALKVVNRNQTIYKGNIGDTDVQFLIDDAKVFLRYNVQ